MKIIAEMVKLVKKKIGNNDESDDANLMVVTKIIMIVKVMYMGEVTIITKVMRMKVNTQRR